MDMPTECEACPNPHSKEAPLRMFMGMWMCPICVSKNKELTEKANADADKRVKDVQEKANEVLQINRILSQAKAVVSNIEVKTDIFNAQTVALIDVAKAIEADPAIENKNGAIAEYCLKTYQTMKEKIFANQQENVELANKQSAIQKYLNELKNKLTEAERERYKLLEVNYQPNKVKIANKPINSPAKPKKYDKIELIKAAQRANVPVSVIQMLCVAKNMTPTQASDSLLNAGSKPELSENN